MKVKEAKKKIKKIANKKFKDIFSKRQLEQINRHKGSVGQLLEQKIGLKLSNKNRDFKNGELKTYKADKNKYPTGRIYITQISSRIDKLIKNIKFRKTKLYKKIKNLLLVPVYKNGNPEEWMFLEYLHIKATKFKYEFLYEQIKKDYNFICKEIKKIVKNNEKINSKISGKYLEIRSKDTKNKNGDYHPICSQKYDKVIADKNFAFYFTENFIEDIIIIKKNKFK